MVEWNDWKHVALVYEAETGDGTWKVYLDGELHGSAQNTAKPSYANPPNWPFLIGGRHNNATDWKGCIDYVRVSKAALQPSQFLRTNGGAAATDVVATWPLDVSDEMFFEGADISGNENHLDRHWQDKSPDTSSKWMLQAKDDGTFDLVGRSNFRSTYYLEETFNAGAIDWSAWHHVALVYDPLSGEEGVWTFFVDAKSIGTVANRSRPNDASLMVPRDLAIAGGYDGRVDGFRKPCRMLTVPFTGMIDDWKFTRKALTAQELDWVPLSGGVIVVR